VICRNFSNKNWGAFVKFNHILYLIFKVNNLYTNNYMKNKKIKTVKHYFKIISRIENIRKKNNKNWMDILRTAFKYAPKNTAKIMFKNLQ
jgi:hypothetical protein